jgi:hypothetical protein
LAPDTNSNPIPYNKYLAIDWEIDTQKGSDFNKLENSCVNHPSYEAKVKDGESLSLEVCIEKAQ